jgi:imidazoleglycerol-phosphate dehydratase
VFCAPLLLNPFYSDIVVDIVFSIILQVNLSVKARKTSQSRKTKETEISVSVDLDEAEPIDIDTGVPFFDHLLKAMGFHGGFSLVVKAAGDLSVDAHHLVEDTGIVLGDVFLALAGGSPSIQRFGHAVIPMDEALSEVSIDVCGRSACVYRARFPQKLVGAFDTALIREFLHALAQHAKICLHASVREGENSHHMAECLFKALGRALAGAYAPAAANRQSISTKGTIA